MRLVVERQPQFFFERPAHDRAEAPFFGLRAALDGPLKGFRNQDAGGNVAAECLLSLFHCGYNIQYYTQVNKNVAKNIYCYYTRRMANQPDPNTVATSFTLPRQLFAAVKRKAKSEMTNQSDIVRRALLNYLPATEREMVLREITDSEPDEQINSAKIVREGSKVVAYKIRRRNKPAAE